MIKKKTFFLCLASLLFFRMCKLLNTFSDGVICGHDRFMTSTILPVGSTYLPFYSQHSHFSAGHHFLTHAMFYANVIHEYKRD